MNPLVRFYSWLLYALGVTRRKRTLERLYRYTGRGRRHED